jgi:hypothetical protein
MKIFPRILLIAILLPAFAWGNSTSPKASTGEECKDSITQPESSSLRKVAEEILSGYSPYDKRTFHLKTLDESKYTGVYLGSAETGEQFIVKVNSLSEAFNDYYGLKILKKISPTLQTQIGIIDSVFLTPKGGAPIELHTQVIQKNPYAKGRPLAEALVDLSVPRDRRFRLHRAYTDWLREVAMGLRADGFQIRVSTPTENFYKKHKSMIVKNPDFLKLQPPILKAFKSWQAIFKNPGEVESASKGLDQLLRGQFKNLISDPTEDLLILIKSDNVMVNDADELTLFDPF